MSTTYSDYKEERVCDDCGHAPHDIRYRICPKCGGKLTEQVGRWIITKNSYPWWYDFFGIWDDITYHEFIVGREND